MIETTAIPDAILPASSNEKKFSRDDVAAGFSFGAAMSALEGRASQALETFGAAPKDALAAQSVKNQSAGANTPQPKPDHVLANQDQSTPGDVQKQAQSSAPEHAGKAPTPQPSVIQASAPQHATPLPPLNGAGPLPLQSQPPFAKAEAASLRALDNAKFSASKTLTPAAPKPAAAPTQDFAKLLARRLDSGATSFELRLDPPELGRVEARMKLSDDGQSTLALKFENQSTMDLFARDEAALRNALLGSGFEFGEERLEFSLAEADEHTALARQDVSTDTLSYEPLFLAPFSQGAVDLRI